MTSAQTLPPLPGLSLTSRDVERALLGYLLLCGPPAADDLLARGVAAEHFGHTPHRELWALLVHRHSLGLPVDTLALFDVVEDWALYNGAAYVVGHADKLPTFVLVPGYVRQLQEAHHRRETRRVLRDSTEVVGDMGIPMADLEAQVAAAFSAAPATTTRSWVELVSDAQSRLDEDQDGRRAVYMPTGIRDWDENPDWMGLCGEGVTLVLGASGMGKSSLLRRLALGLAVNRQETYLHLAEDSADKGTDALLFSLAGVDRKAWLRICRSSFQRQDAHVLRDRLNGAAQLLQVLPLRVTQSGLTVEQLAAKARVLHRLGKCDVLVVDHLHALKGSTAPGLRLGDQVGQVGHRMVVLHELHAELGIPVVVGAQISGEKQGLPVDPRPEMWDCQWSSTAHQFAEEVLGLFRADYCRDRDPTWEQRGGRGRANTIEVIARKRRMGALGTLELSFDGPTRWVGDRLWGPA